MSKRELPRIDPSVFAAAAVAQPDPVANAAKPAASVLSVVPVGARQKARAKASSTHGNTSREGRVQIMGWFPPATRLALKRVALESGKTLEHVMGEAFDQYLEHQRASE